MFIDTHCHVDDCKIEDKAIREAEWLKAGVEKVINMSCDKASMIMSYKLSKELSSVYFGVGVHPEFAREYGEQEENLIKELSKKEKCVAVGEIGLDYHWDTSYKSQQINAFISQIRIANNLKLPISVHVRDATGDAIKILKDNKNYLGYGGVMHCFSGSTETAKICLDLGFYISFAGTVTFKNAVNLKEVAAYLPIDRILTETDSPYLSPHPLRGMVNSPKNIPIILSELAKIRGEEEEYLALNVMQNAERIFYKLKK